MILISENIFKLIRINETVRASSVDKSISEYFALIQ